MNNNYQANKKEIDRFRKELKAMIGDISEIDEKVLTRAVDEGLAVAKYNTPVITGFMRKSWNSPAVKRYRGCVEKELANSADYASFVNDGHRQEVGRYVPAIGKTLKKPWVEGQYMLEKAINKADRVIPREFEKEVERVNREHDK